MESLSLVDALLLFLSILAAAAATYPAIENRSPVLVMVMLLGRAKNRQLSVSTLHTDMKKRISGLSLVQLTDKGGYIKKKGVLYKNTFKGHFLGGFFSLIQKILGLDQMSDQSHD